jgi:hypothetical protein
VRGQLDEADARGAEEVVRLDGDAVQGVGVVVEGVGGGGVLGGEGGLEGGEPGLGREERVSARAGRFGGGGGD